MRDESSTATSDPSARFGPAAAHLFSDALHTDRALMALVRTSLGFPPQADAVEHDHLDWSALCDLMWVHRLGGLVWPHLGDHANSAPAAAGQWIRHFRDATSRMNGANLMTMRRVLPRLRAEGIPTLAFKGPVLQQMAYGSVFLRPASDLDILVRPSDFDRAGDVLAGLDYTLAEVCRSLWWRAGLGEQHFRSGLASGTTLDLHHRVQQPGCPLPRKPARFFGASTVLTVAGDSVPTLSHTHSALLAAMSYVKALHHREPAARYAIDLVALARGLTSAQWQEIETEAQVQGLTNTLGLTVRGATLLLGEDTLPFSPDRRVLAQTPDATLVRMTLRPTDPSIDWPRRRALLHALFDNKLAYPAGLAAMVGSDLLRQAGEGSRRRQPRAMVGV